MSEGNSPFENARPEGAARSEVGAIDNDARLWGMLCHLSALSVYFTGVGLWLGPLACWLVKRNESAFVDDQGKESLNFQISMLIYKLVGACLIPCFGIGFLIVIALLIEANHGVYYRYPMTIRFLK